MRPAIDLVRGITERVLIFLHDGRSYGLLPAHPAHPSIDLCTAICRTIIIVRIVVIRAIINDAFLLLLTFTPLLHLHRNR